MEIEGIQLYIKEGFLWPDSGWIKFLTMCMVFEKSWKDKTIWFTGRINCTKLWILRFLFSRELGINKCLWDMASLEPTRFLEGKEVITLRK